MKNIYQKIAEVQSHIGTITKDSTNPFFKSKYFDINSLLAQLQPLLSENGLIILQPIIDGCVITQIIDIESGDKVESSIKLPEISDPQKLGSAVTYYRRYTCQSLLSLQAEDDDGNAASKAKLELLPGTPEWEKAKKYIKDGGKVELIQKKYNILPNNLKQLQK